MPSLQRLFPFLSWPRPSTALMRGEVLAGLTVGLLMVPQAVAYAALAGMPLVTGLYAALLPALVGVLWGASTRLSVGPTALTCLLVAASLSGLAEPGSARWVDLAVWLALPVWPAAAGAGPGRLRLAAQRHQRARPHGIHPGGGAAHHCLATARAARAQGFAGQPADAAADRPARGRLRTGQRGPAAARAPALAAPAHDHDRGGRRRRAQRRHAVRRGGGGPSSVPCRRACPRCMCRAGRGWRRWASWSCRRW
jgi:hypothetical protein